MKSIGARFSMVVGLFAVAFSLVFLHFTWSSARVHMRQMNALQAELALEFNLAIRGCAAEVIHPAGIRGASTDELAADMMSTTFVAHQVFEKVRERFPDYIIKFSSLNPRNPENLADPEEVRFLNYFREHPEETRWNGTVEMNGREYFTNVSAVRMKESCLRCHGQVEDSPSFVVDRYGDKGGFNQSAGDVAGIDIIAVPSDNMDSALLRSAGINLLVTTALLVILFGVILMAFRAIVSRRLAAITGHFRVASEQDEDKPLTPVAEHGEDEIGILARSFNALVNRLTSLHESLEQRVKMRTDELSRANRTLQDEIEERERLEREIHKIGAREQQRIGQELHDGLGQELTGLSYMAANLHLQLREKNLREAEEAAELAHGIPDVLGQLQRIVRGMIPLELSAQDLMPALEGLLAKIEKQTGVRCRLEVDPSAQPADSDAALQLYRIAQEAITNAIKHGRADEVVVSLRVRDGHTEFAVRDDGVGLPVIPTEAAGCGLRVMRYRARVIGGSMDVRSAEEKGTSVVLTIPAAAS